MDRQRNDLNRETRFTFFFGRAALAWAYVEHTMFDWFTELTGLKEEMARSIFFSASSYRARSQMLRAVLQTPPDGVDERDAACLQALIKRADAYSQTRNNIAHGFSRRSSDEIERIVVAQARGTPESEIDTNQLMHVANNFADLSELFLDALVGYIGKTNPEWVREGTQYRYERVQERLNKLPVDPRKHEAAGNG